MFRIFSIHSCIQALTKFGNMYGRKLDIVPMKIPPSEIYLTDLELAEYKALQGLKLCGLKHLKKSLCE